MPSTSKSNQKKIQELTEEKQRLLSGIPMLETMPKSAVKSSNYEPINPTAHQYPEEIPARFNCILLDPPWDIYQKASKNCKKSKVKSAGDYYDLMSMEEILDLPINDLLEENAHVWCWITNAVFPYIQDLANSWGLTYRGVFHWIKSNHMGLGMYLRGGSESIIFFTKGRAPMLTHNQLNWAMAPNLQHSEKPSEIYEIIERCSPGEYLEIFARQKHPGWYTWGREIESDIGVNGQPVPEYTKNAEIWAEKVKKEKLEKVAEIDTLIKQLGDDKPPKDQP